MSQVVEQIAELTGFRDRDVLDVSLVSALRDLLGPDEVAIYREWPQVPLSALDQLGPAWEAAYRSAPELNQTSAHTRTDITQWLPVDG